MKLQGKTYWLVGASEGLGRALAKELAQEGANLVVSSRNAARLEALVAEIPGAWAVPMDVTDSASVRRAAETVRPIDGVIFNAGAYDPMPASEWNTEQALNMCDVNYLGALRVIGEVLPDFVERGSGDITLVGSLAGYRGLPKAVGYGASKAALISLAETMRYDLKGSGVTVRLVNPGFIRTRLTEKNTFKMPMLMSPDQAARHVVRAMLSRRFRTDFPAPFSWVMRAIQFLPDFVAFRLG
ncbi:SDR family NAD(P)-dependent oxidoreductase [Aliiruegeria sabulilitoris]|uniref:SDR family NAD(P)-dependent oxidoreductase n=1 Tax=Aliiruegeria sabulilitoris TaxID=1510458 RepID=UPI00082F1CF9|nr:SDR family NAD(P)-dependent oxidoreductase [Aliiruegeria sabulilitoris]NDR59263.1 SDR family NAD(P)-dependent oxidoreductase [Pseudoruegeria sp. M32A2M]